MNWIEVLINRSVVLIHKWFNFEAVPKVLYPGICLNNLRIFFRLTLFPSLSNREGFKV